MEASKCISIVCYNHDAQYNYDNGSNVTTLLCGPTTIMLHYAYYIISLPKSNRHKNNRLHKYNVQVLSKAFNCTLDLDSYAIPCTLKPEC